MCFFSPNALLHTFLRFPQLPPNLAFEVEGKGQHAFQTNARTLHAFNPALFSPATAIAEGITLTLGRTHDLTSIDTMPLLRLTLLGHELLLKDHQMGVIVVDLALLPMDGTAVTEWKTLEPTSDMQPGTSCGRCVWLCSIFYVASFQRYAQSFSRSERPCIVRGAALPQVCVSGAQGDGGRGGMVSVIYFLFIICFVTL